MITQYALGCAFTVQHLFMNFPYKKLKLTCAKCHDIIGDNHRDKLVKKVFRKFLQVMFLDVVQNNVTFWFSLAGGKKCNIHMRRFYGRDFKNLRQHGKWKEIDITKSWFCAYAPSLYLLGNRTPRVKNIYLNKYYRDIITVKTNQGFPYGDGKIDTTVKDYYQQMYQLFPDVHQQDIRRILNFAVKTLYLHNSYGGDVLVRDGNFWCYIGNLKGNPLDHFFYYIRKLTIKLRVLYRRKKIQWDGYYYFALSNAQYQRYLDQKNKKGRPKKHYKFGTVYIYQIYDECRINEYYKRYIFRIPYITRLKIKYFIRDLVTDKAELVTIRTPLKFKDIRIIDNEYEFL